MIEWKKVNKELPKEDCFVLIRVFYEEAFKPPYAYICAGFDKKEEGFMVSKKAGFKFLKKHKYTTIHEDYRVELTHWAYINEPKTEEKC